MMTPASTSSPTAMARPPRVIALRPRPRRASGMAAPSVESGSSASTTSGARRFPSITTSTSGHEEGAEQERAVTPPRA